MADEAENMITVKLKPVTGNEFSVTFSKSGTVLELKETISKTYDAPADALRLIYKGTLLGPSPLSTRTRLILLCTYPLHTPADAQTGKRSLPMVERTTPFCRPNTEGCSHD
jgi:hypothetical protein